MISPGTDIGLASETIKKVLDSMDYADKVEQDIYEARQIGVRAVPYLVINDRYAGPGAQPTGKFSGALTPSWK